MYQYIYLHSACRSRQESIPTHTQCIMLCTLIVWELNIFSFSSFPNIFLRCSVQLPSSPRPILQWATCPVFASLWLTISPNFVSLSLPSAAVDRLRTKVYRPDNIIYSLFLSANTTGTWILYLLIEWVLAYCKYNETRLCINWVGHLCTLAIGLQFKAKLLL